MIERELELLGAGALGALLKRKARHAPQPGGLCANCGTELRGLYCHVCGQTADNHHRSIWRLAWEGIEGLTHLDGRLAQTLPPLFFQPGKLAKDHFEGRRQRHVPPFRLFLISLLVFVFVLEGLFHAGVQKTEGHRSAEAILEQKLAEKAAAKAGAAPPAPAAASTAAAPAPPAKSTGLHMTVGKPDLSANPVSVKINGAEVAGDDDKDKASSAVDTALDGAHGKNQEVKGWFKPRLKKAIENKEYYLMVLFTWAHRLAFVLLPILAGLLALVYVRARRFYIYDHLIVSMQFLSFVFLVSALAWIIPDPVRGWAVMAASLWAPINLYQTLRGAYGSRRWTSVIKTLFLWCSTLTLFSILMVGLMGLALAEMA